MAVVEYYDSHQENIEENILTVYLTEEEMERGLLVTFEISEKKMNAHKGGMCKVVPPKSYRPVIDKSPFEIEISDLPNLKLCCLEKLTAEGSSKQRCYTYSSTNQLPEYNLHDFVNVTNDYYNHTPSYNSLSKCKVQDLEKFAWKHMETKSSYYSTEERWNLFSESCKLFNINKTNCCVEKLWPDSYGLSIPTCTVGSFGSYACYHWEDLFLNSINYHLCGADKIWYSIPQKDISRFQQIVENIYSSVGRGIECSCPVFLKPKCHLINPTILEESGLQVNKVVQEAGTFVFTFPKGIHSDLKLGANIITSRNIASYASCTYKEYENAEWCRWRFLRNKRFKDGCKQQVWMPKRIINQEVAGWLTDNPRPDELPVTGVRKPHPQVPSSPVRWRHCTLFGIL